MSKNNDILKCIKKTKNKCEFCNETIFGDNLYFEYCHEKGYFCSEEHLKRWLSEQKDEWPTIDEGEMCYNCGRDCGGLPLKYYIEGWMSSGYFCSKECLDEWRNED